MFLSDHSEKDEGFLHISFDFLDFLSENVEADCLGEGSALADSDDISLGETEGWGAMDGYGLMALLESVVLLDVMKVVTANDNGVSHFS